MNQDDLIRDIWNELIAKPHNEKGIFQLSPAKLKSTIEKHLGKQEKPCTLKPFQIGQTYDTKYQTKEKFKIVEIKYKRDKELNKDVPYYFNGYLLIGDELRSCTLNVDRLIQLNY